MKYLLIILLFASCEKMQLSNRTLNIQHIGAYKDYLEIENNGKIVSINSGEYKCRKNDKLYITYRFRTNNKNGVYKIINKKDTVILNELNEHITYTVK